MFFNFDIIVSAAPPSPLQAIGFPYICNFVHHDVAQKISFNGGNFDDFHSPLFFSGSEGRGGRILKELKEGKDYPPGMFYHCNLKAWMNEAMMLLWVEEVWRPFAEKRSVSMLIIDSHTAHMTAPVKKAIEDCGTILEFIPGGYTSKLQAMDVGLNKPFKDRLRVMVEAFVFNHQEGAKPHRRDVAEWIKEAWDGITLPTLINTWKKVW